MDDLSNAFDDPIFREKVNMELLDVVLQADLNASKYGSSGLLKGSIRKKHLIDFLVGSFGYDNVEIVERLPDVDLKIFKIPIKIRTITGKSGVKIKWTTDKEKVEKYFIDFNPTCGMILVRKRKHLDEKPYLCGLFYIPVVTQEKVFSQLGLNGYIKRPPPETNSRGIELTRIALEMLLKDYETRHIDVKWF